MRDKVLSCLGRRKRDCSHTEAASGGTRAGDPATSRGHRGGKLPRDEVHSAGTGHRAASPRCFQTIPGLDGSTGEVSREDAVGPSCASGTEEERAVRPGREDHASDSPTRAMDDQPLEGDSPGRAVGLTGTSVTSDPDTERTVSPDQALDRGASVPDHPAEKMTKSECEAGPCAHKAAGDKNESRKDSDQAPQRPAGGQTFPGTIPKLIITRDPSPTRAHGTPAQFSPGSCLELHPDDESPCSDSGCGGSPALMRSPRKLSNSSSIGLSSASSFEESEDDFTGSDIESSLSPARSLCSPDDGTGVSVLSQQKHWFKIVCAGQSLNFI